MKIGEIIGRTITNIYCSFAVQDEWLDRAECYIELDKSITMRIPIGESKEVYLCEPPGTAKTLFDDLEDHPVYHINERRNAIGNMSTEDFKIHKIDYRENKMKFIPQSKIIDVIWFNDEGENVYLLLDNGRLITETPMSPSGTGHAGLNIYDSLEELIKTKEEKAHRLSERK